MTANTITTWVLAVAVSVAVGACAVMFDAEATQQQDTDALSSREWAGQQVCGPDATAVWLDDKTIECLRNRHGAR